MSEANDLDLSLLDAYRNGDDGALSALLARHSPAVHRFGLKMCGDAEDAKDVLQETLLAAARGHPVPAVDYMAEDARSLGGLPLSLPGTTGVPQPMPGGRLHQAP